MENYKDLIKTLANDGRDELTRVDILIKGMAQLIDSLLDYRYAVNNYKGEGTVIEDKTNQIKNAMVLVKTDSEVLAEQLGIAEDVEKKARKRAEKIVRRINER